MTVRRVVPDLHSTDPAGTREFYSRVLGMEVGMDLGWIVNYGSPDVHAAQVNVMTADATAPVTPDLTVEVDDVDAVHALAVAAGYQVVHPLTDEPWGVRRFFVRDPTGAVVNVMSHR